MKLIFFVAFACLLSQTYAAPKTFGVYCSGGGIRAGLGCSLALAELQAAQFGGHSFLDNEVELVKGISGGTWGMMMYAEARRGVADNAHAGMGNFRVRGAGIAPPNEGKFLLHLMKTFYDRLGVDTLYAGFSWGPSVSSLSHGISHNFFDVWRKEIGEFVIDPWKRAPGYIRLKDITDLPTNFHFNYVQTLWVTHTGVIRNSVINAYEYICDIIVPHAGVVGVGRVNEYKKVCAYYGPGNDRSEFPQHAITAINAGHASRRVKKRQRAFVRGISQGATIADLPLIEVLSVCSSAAAGAPWKLARFEPSLLGGAAVKGDARARLLASTLANGGTIGAMQDPRTKLIDAGIVNNLPFFPKPVVNKILAFEYSGGDAWNFGEGTAADPLANFFTFVMNDRTAQSALFYHFLSWTTPAHPVSHATPNTRAGRLHANQNDVFLYTVAVTDGANAVQQVYFIYPFLGAAPPGVYGQHLSRAFPTVLVYPDFGAVTYDRARFKLYINEYYHAIRANMPGIMTVLALANNNFRDIGNRKSWNDINTNAGNFLVAARDFQAFHDNAVNRLNRISNHEANFRSQRPEYRFASAMQQARGVQICECCDKNEPFRPIEVDYYWVQSLNFLKNNPEEMAEYKKLKWDELKAKVISMKDTVAKYPRALADVEMLEYSVDLMTDPEQQFLVPENDAAAIATSASTQVLVDAFMSDDEWDADKFVQVAAAIIAKIAKEADANLYDLPTGEFEWLPKEAPEALTKEKDDDENVLDFFTKAELKKTRDVLLISDESPVEDDKGEVLPKPYFSRYHEDTYHGWTAEVLQMVDPSRG